MLSHLSLAAIVKCFEQPFLPMRERRRKMASTATVMPSLSSLHQDEPLNPLGFASEKDLSAFKEKLLDDLLRFSDGVVSPFTVPNMQEVKVLRTIVKTTAMLSSSILRHHLPITSHAR